MSDAEQLVPEDEGPKYDFAGCKTASDPIGPYYKEDVIAAIYATGGNYAAMAYLLQRRRNAVRNYILAHRDLIIIMEEVKEGFIDRIESSVFASAMAGDGPNARFILSTIGRDRGYSTKTDTNVNVTTIEAKIDMTKIPADVRQKLRDAILLQRQQPETIEGVDYDEE